MSFAHMKQFVQAAGGNIREAKIKDGQHITEMQLRTDPSFRDSLYIWEFGKTEFESIPLKLFHERHSEAAGFTVKFNGLYNQRPLIGDVLYDSKTGIYWLCWESYNRDDINSAGLLKRINVWIKWQDDKGNVYEYPAYDDNSTQYNSGVQGDSMITLGSSNHMLFMPCDDNTVLIDHDLRFFLDKNLKKPTVFKVTQNDTTAMNYEKGIIKVTGTEDEYRPEKDRIDLWLCDYKEPDLNDFEISYEGKPSVMSGMSKKFTATREDAVFSLILPEKLNGIVTVSENGIVSVKAAQGIIGEGFILNADCPDGSHAELSLSVSGGV